MLHGFSYREKDPHYNIYEQQFSKEHHRPIRQNKDVLSVINALSEKFLDTDKQTLVQKSAATHRESLKEL